jgi:hypothetical protein
MESLTFFGVSVEYFGVFKGLLDLLELISFRSDGGMRIPPSLRNERRFHCNSEKSEREALEHSDITPHSSSFTTKTGRVPTRALPMVQRGR